MTPEQIKDMFVEAFGEMAGDPRVTKQYHDAIEAALKAKGLDDEALKATITAKAQEVLAEQIEAARKRQEEEFDRKLAETQRVPMEPMAFGMLEKGIPEPSVIKRPCGDNQALRDLQWLNDDVYIMRALTRNDDKPAHAAKRRTELFDLYCRERDMPEHVRTMLTTSSTAGGDWVPTILSSEFHRLIEDQIKIAGLFPAFRMTSKSVDMPTLAGDPDVYVPATEVSAPYAQDASVVSGKVSFTAKDFMTYRRVSDNLEDDAIVSALDILRQKLTYGMARMIDTCVLDGDTTNPHQDTDITATTDPRKQWIGLRKKALTNTGANEAMGTFNLTTLLGPPRKMGKYGEPEQMALIMSHNTFWGHLPTLANSGGHPVFLPGTFGGQINPVINGMSGIHIMGTPVVSTTLMRLVLNSSSVYQNGQTLTVLFWVNKQAWLRGIREDSTVEVARGLTGAEQRFQSVVLTWRGDFQHMDGSGLSTGMGTAITTT